jgi:SAM-dependent methyltransferase
VDIIDYGCGLAQTSRSLAMYLNQRGIAVRLFLVDIPTMLKDFLLWLGKQTGIETTFLDVTVTTPIPVLPKCDICIATEFFEHVYNPLIYFERIHNALKDNGLLITNISDHTKEFMHVTPNLQELRSKIQSLPYDMIMADKIYKKNVEFSDRLTLSV